MVDIGDLAVAEWNAVVIMDKHGRILRWNDAAQAMLGWSEAEVKGRFGYEIAFPEGDDPQFQAGNLDAPGLFNVARGRTAVTKDGQRIRVEIIALRAGTSEGDVIMGMMRPAKAVRTGLKAGGPTVRTASKNQRRDARLKVESLTGRQGDILLRMLMGQANKIMAFELGLSKRTVEAHRRTLMDKLGVNSSIKAIEIALLAGIDQQR